MADILDGKIVARKIREQAASIAANLKIQGKNVKLAIVLANDDPSSLSYVASISKSAKKLGIETLVEKPAQINQSSLELKISELAKNNEIRGIMIQAPIPSGIDMSKLSSLIPLDKDVDGANPLSAGRLAQGLVCFAPATAQAIMEILKYYRIELAGKHVAVIGRSVVVGKPAAQLLLREDATLSICHSKTKNIKQLVGIADILVVAIGRSKFVTKEFVNKNLTVIDVGTNFDEAGKMTGDVDFESVEPIVRAITPVPGGVGPVTTAVLLKHVCESAKTPI